MPVWLRDKVSKITKVKKKLTNPLSHDSMTNPLVGINFIHYLYIFTFFLKSKIITNSNNILF